MKNYLNQIKDLVEEEGTFSFSRSSGPGGQNVNKLNTKVRLSWDIKNSKLNESLKEKLLTKIGDVIQVVSEESRSQDRNKKIALEKMLNLIKEVLREEKTRRKTHTPKKEKEKRLREKHRRSDQIKKRHIDLEEEI